MVDLKNYFRAFWKVGENWTLYLSTPHCIKLAAAAAAAAAAADIAVSQRVRWACLTLSLGAWHSMREGISKLTNWRRNKV